MKTRIPLSIIFISSIISVYFIDRSLKSVSEHSSTEVADYYILFIIVIFLVYHFIFNPVSKAYAIYYFILLVSGLSNLPFGGILNVQWIYAIGFFEVVRCGYIPQKKYEMIFVYLAVISVLIQLFENWGIYDRITLSNGDPNYSAYYIIILSLLLYLLDKKILSICVLSFSILTFSRANILATTIFILGNIFLRISKTKLPINGFIYFLAILLIPYLGSIIFNSFFATPVETKSSDFIRLFDFLDQSNVDRSYSNLYFIEAIFNDPYVLLSGVDLLSYTDRVFRNTPHTSIYALIFNYGITYAIALLFILSRIFKKISTSNMARLFLYSLIVPILTMGGVIWGIQVIILGVIFNLFSSVAHSSISD